MADNTVLNEGSGGDTLATDDIGGVKHQRVKVEHGANGSATDVSTASPMPVDLRADNVGGIEVIQGTAGDFNCTEASAAAIKTAVELLDNAVDGAYLNVNVNAAGTDLSMNAGVLTAQTQRVTIATDDEVNNLLGTIDADTGAIKTAVELIDNAISGNEMQVDVVTMPANTSAAGTVTANGGTVVITLPAGCSSAALQITGTWSGQLEFEGSVDGTNYQSVEGSNGTSTVNATTTNNIFVLPGAGYAKLRVRASSWVSGTATVTFIGTVGTAASILTGAIPAGANLMGKVGIDQTTPGTTNAVAIISGQAGIAAGSGAVDALTPRVILATDDPAVALLTTIDADTGAIKTAVELIDNSVAVLGTATYSEATTSGTIAGAVRNDDLATLANTDNEIAPLQVDANGALYVSQAGDANQTGQSKIKQASGVAVGGAPGTDDIIAAVASKKILILALGLFATSTTANNVFLDNADNDLLFNTANPLPLSLDADGDTVPGFVLPFNPGGWMKTDTANEAVTLNTSAAQDIAYTVTYREVD
jgi:hypothetical protein